MTTTTSAAPAGASGTIIAEGDSATLHFRRRLPFSVEAVWAALTEPAQRAAWFGPTQIEPRQGGTIEMIPDDPPVPPEFKRLTGRILIWDPPCVLEHEWKQAIVEEGSVRYALTADGPDATILTFTHRGLSPRNAQGFIPGTHAYLDRLEAHLAGAPIPPWQERYNAVADTYGVPPVRR
jgi:uncharacterized protein YndB with AHSA1/START domain